MQAEVAPGFDCVVCVCVGGEALENLTNELEASMN